MRIRFLHTFFYPDKSSVSQIISDLAFDLADKGHEVEVIASRGTYEGKGQKLPKRESVNGVAIRRIWSPNKGKDSIFARLSDQGSYTLGSAWRALISRKVDRLVVLTNPPMYAAVATILRLLRGQEYVFVVMDLYPDFAVKGGALSPNGLVTKIMRWITKWTLKKAHRVVVLGSCMADAVAARGVPRERIAIVQNWADKDAIKPIDPETNPLRKEMNLGNAFVVMYSGNMGLSHCFDDILEVANRLKDRDDIRFFFVGGGIRRCEIEQYAAKNELNNIIIRGYFPRDQLGNSLTLGDAHFVSLRESFLGLVVPSKAYGIMAAGRPMIYQGSTSGEIARMLTAEGGGVVVPQGEPDAIEAAITGWADDRAAAKAIGDEARKVFEDNYTMEIGLKKYFDVLES